MKKFALSLIAFICAMLLCLCVACSLFPEGESSDGGSSDSSQPGTGDSWEEFDGIVEGRVFVFSDVKFTYDSTVAEEDKLSKSEIAEWKKEYKNSELVFKDDNVCVLSWGADGQSSPAYYFQDGTKVYVFGDKDDAKAGDKTKAEGYFKVDGKKLSISFTEDGITQTMIYTYDRVYKDSSSTPGGEGDENSSALAGKVYTFDDLQVSYDSTVSKDDKLSDADINEGRKAYKGMEFAFYKNGLCTISFNGEDAVVYYVQKENTAYIYDSKTDADRGNTSQATFKITVEKNKISIANEAGGITITLIFKYKGPASGIPQTPDDGGYDKDGVAGKIYVFADYSVEYGSTAINPPTDEELARMEARLDGCTLIFYSDGTFLTLIDGEEHNMYYIEMGSTLYIFRNESDAIKGDTTKAEGYKITVINDEIVFFADHDGITFVMTFVYKGEVADDKPTKPGEGDSGNSGNTDKKDYVDVAGMTGTVIDYEFLDGELSEGTHIKLRASLANTQIVFNYDGSVNWITAEETYTLYYEQNENVAYVYTTPALNGADCVGKWVVDGNTMTVILYIEEVNVRTLFLLK